MSRIIPYDKRDQRDMVTPEGVNLQVQLADMGARLGAFTIDIGIMIISLTVVSFILISVGIEGRDRMEMASIIWLLFFFFLRSGYFMAFEMGRRAATPGKRIMKIRVAARGQGRLSANAVFVRNALRELEFFLPLSFFLTQSSSVNGWISTLGFLWSMAFLFFPLLNKDRLRAGDLVAGTWVVRSPKPVLADDLSKTRADTADNLGRFIFSRTQVEAYGVHELQILERVIRANDPYTLQDVANRIRAKISWEPVPAELDRDFLKAYYKSLRGHLETRMLFGVRRKDKHDTSR